MGVFFRPLEKSLCCALNTMICRLVCGCHDTEATRVRWMYTNNVIINSNTETIGCYIVKSLYETMFILSFRASSVRMMINLFISNILKYIQEKVLQLSLKCAGIRLRCCSSIIEKHILHILSQFCCPVEFPYKF